MAELDILVMGAGIAGLGAAITLSRAGHNVTVYTGCRDNYVKLANLCFVSRS